MTLYIDLGHLLRQDTILAEIEKERMVVVEIGKDVQSPSTHKMAATLTPGSSRKMIKTCHTLNLMVEPSFRSSRDYSFSTKKGSGVVTPLGEVGVIPMVQTDSPKIRSASHDSPDLSPQHG